MALGADLRDYRLLWMGGIPADVASTAFVFATPLIVLRMTDSAGVSGLVAGLLGLAVVVGRSPGGALADRYDRRHLLVASQLGQAVIFGVMAAVLFAGSTSVVLYAGLSMLVAFIASTNDAAEDAAITQVVPQERLEQSHGEYQGRNQAAQLAGPALGGVLLGVGPGWVCAVAAVACVVAMVCDLLIQADLSVEKSEEENFAQSVMAGFSYVGRESVLRDILGVQFFYNLAVAGLMFFMVIDLERAGVSAGVIGLLSGLLGAVGIAGAAIVPAVTKRLSFHQTQLFCVFLTVVSLATSAALSGHWAMAIPLALSILIGPSAGAAVFARISRSVPQERLGRVISVQALNAMGGSALSRPAVGWAYGGLGAASGALPVAAAVISLGWAVAFWRNDDDPQYHRPPERD
ncbi:MFS transporter [Kytococcus sedentarius]|uniref:MFS transporter n=1 Tax=Kytococcus sedentarius TaxID=1276 RepID=UPI0038796F7C